MASFQMFTDANLKELGVLAYGPRHKMLLAIAGRHRRFNFNNTYNKLTWVIDEGTYKQACLYMHVCRET